MIVIGNPRCLAFEILSDDLPGELAEVYIVVAGRRISGRAPVFVPTFVSELEAFVRCQNSASPSSDEEAFHLLHSVMESNEEAGGITVDDVWRYYCLHSIDDAVDDWDIYVFDSGDKKRIVCRPVRGAGMTSDISDRIIGASLSREEFNETFRQLISTLA